MMDEKKLVTNEKFSEIDPLFKDACDLAGVKPTSRQASKWRNQRGSAYSFRHKAKAQ